MNERSFKKLFFEREFQVLRGKKDSGFLVLIGILLLTLLSLAFALGSLKQLAKRMDNPFTNWVDMPVSIAHEEKIPELKKFFQDPEERNRYLLNDISGHVGFYQYFYHQEKKGLLFPKKGRTIQREDKILEKILDNNEGNLLVKHKEMENCDIILTKEALLSLGYKDWKSQKKVALGVDEYTIYVNVAAVVKELPNFSQFICTPRVYHYLTLPFSETNFLEGTGSNVLPFLANTEIAGDVETLVETYWSDNNPQNIKEVPFSWNENDELKYFEVVFPFQNIPSKKEWKKFLEEKGLMAVTNWSCVNSSFDEITNPYYIAFHFDELLKVRDFKEVLSTKFGLEISMDQVEAKENFAMVSRLTFAISSMLFIFGLISILVYIYNVLNTHLEKIKPNLGTFKAFGLDDNWLLGVYSNVILRFLLISIGVALILTILIGILTNLLTQEPIFDLFHWMLLLVIIVIFLVNLYFIKYWIGKILKDTPGDLIYGR